MIKAGQLPATKIGDRTVIRHADLEVFLSANRGKPLGPRFGKAAKDNTAAPTAVAA